MIPRARVFGGGEAAVFCLIARTTEESVMSTVEVGPSPPGKGRPAVADEHFTNGIATAAFAHIPSLGPGRAGTQGGQCEPGEMFDSTFIPGDEP